MTDWKSSLRADPIPWLLENGCPSIRYRVLTELLDRGKEDPDVLAARQAVLEYPPAVALQRKQRKDGTWEYSEPDWDELRWVVTGHGPETERRLGFRRASRDETAWVRRAVLADAA